MNFPHLDLNTVWFVLIGVLFTGYAMLDGFDLGIGALHLFTREDAERRVLLNSIGPVWDGNEVWLLAGGGTLYFAFPLLYASGRRGAVRRVPERLRDGVLRLLPGVHAVAGVADFPRGGD